MITKIFLLQVLLSFVVAGLYIGTMTWVAERFGSRLGGFLIAIPSTMLIGLSFIAITQGHAALVESIKIVPATLGTCTIFLMGFVLLYRHGLWLAYLGTVTIWFMLNLPLVIFELSSIGTAILLGSLYIVISTAFFHKQPHTTLPAMRLPRKAFIFRVIFAGSLVAITVLAAKLLGPTWGGLFASFPVVFSVSLLIFAPKHGIGFTTSVAKSMTAGVISNIVFVCGIFWLVPHLGAAYGIIAAYSICLVFALILYRFILRETLKH